MPYDPKIHHRRSIRLKEYDYALDGMYFVTICVQDKQCLFGEIVNNEMILNKNGQIVEMIWNELPHHYIHVELGEFVIMPNHIHGIIILVGAGFKPAHDEQAGQKSAQDERAGFKPAPTRANHGLSEIVRALKTFSARKINELCNTRGKQLWQRNYYEHIIRNEKSHKYIANYIVNNPANWKDDTLYSV